MLHPAVFVAEDVAVEHVGAGEILEPVAQRELAVDHGADRQVDQAPFAPRPHRVWRSRRGHFRR